MPISLTCRLIGWETFYTKTILKGTVIMNKNEISEIKKQFTPAASVITRICGCYVGADENSHDIRFTSKAAFNSLSEDEASKYFDIFKRTLSGNLGKNLINMEFPINEESEGGRQEFLMKLRDSELKDDALIDEFYKNIIDNYTCDGNYYIVLIHGLYDIPGVTSDGIAMEDASDLVYSYLICSICPVNLSKPGLSYDAKSNAISERIRDWVVLSPANGFLFPAFNDRNSDIHSLLYYSKNPEELQTSFIENILGTAAPLSAKSQKESFNSIIESAFGDECDFETIKSIHENLNELLEENKDEPEPVMLDADEVRKIFEKSEIPDEKLELLAKGTTECISKEAPFVATNIAPARKLDIKMPDVEIKVSPDRTDLIESRVIDGRQCLVIKVTDRILVNGLSVTAGKGALNEE